MDDVTLGGGKADVRVVSGDESLPEKIAGQVMLEMVRRGQIRDPRG